MTRPSFVPDYQSTLRWLRSSALGRSNADVVDLYSRVGKGTKVVVE